MKKWAMMIVIPYCCGLWLSQTAQRFETTFVVKAGGSQSINLTLRVVECPLGY